ncbi:MAG: hypothetical protein EON91_02630 [Brevundimonas sp.]|uniref:hypothetical protein n=1 Tax=Brevundimonas sp. TaxID=1871086 RepID=UPI00121ABF71|nr:hypothetical protein [Brevundimonas sp.]RZJ19109.1 MAG: hypothetical protein EON91_02630 [Brevundimonas sp.]
MSVSTGGEHEASLNVLREERRRVREARAAAMADDDLRRDDPAYRQALLTQMLVELTQLDGSIQLLEAAALTAAGGMIAAAPMPALGRWS